MFQQFMQRVFEQGAETVSFQSTLKQVFMRHIYSYSMELFDYMYDGGLKGRTMHSPPNGEDTQFRKVLESLAWVQAEDLEIKSEYYHEQQWKLAIKSLKKANEAGTPEEKMGHLVKAYNTVATSSRLFADPKDSVSPEEVTVVLMYLLVKACPQRMIAAVK